MVFGPGRTDSASHACYVALELDCGFFEAQFQLFIEVSDANRGDGNVQFFAGPDDGVAEKLSFRGVNQWVRREDFFERRQRAT